MSFPSMMTTLSVRPNLLRRLCSSRGHDARDGLTGRAVDRDPGRVLRPFHLPAITLSISDFGQFARRLVAGPGGAGGGADASDDRVGFGVESLQVSHKGPAGTVEHMSPYGEAIGKI